MAKTLYVISDLHLGGAAATADRPSFQMCPPAGQQRLAEFLEHVIRQRGATAGAAGETHLVLAGDIVDYLAEEQFAAFTGDDEAARAKLAAIMDRTAVVWDALAAVVRAGVRLTMLLGNHDVELALPAARRLLLERIGDRGVELVHDNQAFVAGPVLIEHGNRYDAWNAVDHDALRGYRSKLSRREPPPAFRPPAGSELVCRVMNRIKAKYPFVDLLKPEDASLLPLLAVLHPATVHELKTVLPLRRRQAALAFDSDGAPLDPENIAGAPGDEDEAHLELAARLAFGGDPADIGLMETLADYYELVRLGWNGGDRVTQLDRLLTALRARSVAAWQALDVNREVSTYLRPAEAAARRGFQLIVYGHTHLVKRVPLLVAGPAVYLNTGTWADLMQVPEAVVEGDKAEARRQLDAFTDDLVANRLERWRRQIPTFARIELDAKVTGDVYFYDGGDRVERVPDGRLARLAEVRP